MTSMPSEANGAWCAGLLALVLVGCGDDAPMTDSGVGSDTGEATTTTTGLDSTGLASSGADTTGLDSTGTMGETTTVGPTTGSTGDETSTGEPNLVPQPRNDLYFVREDAAPLVVDAATGVLANDLDPEGEALDVASADAVTMAGGTIAVQPDGSFQYDPPAGFFGDDRFTYTAADGSGGTADATVIITVGPVDVELGAVAMGMGGFVIDGSVVDLESGYAVSGGGDVNGDGLDDLVITSPIADAGAGRVWVVFGKADGGPVDLGAIDSGMGGFAILGESAIDPAGEDAAIVGDVSGDGLADVLVGAPQAGPAGRAYLVLGKADGAAVELVDVAMGIGGFTLEGEGAGEGAGTAVAAAGDVNADGLVDLAIGAPDGGPVPGGGRTYVVHGKTDTTAVALADVNLGIGGFVIRGAAFDDNAGATLAGAGDVNADGFDDVLVGAQLANAGGLGNSGRCYVVFGKASTAAVDVATLGSGGFSIDGTASFDEACSAVGGLGDVDGDGRADVAVGSTGAEGALSFSGRVYVVLGKTSTTTVPLTEIAAGLGGFVIDGETVGSFLGNAVGGPGDLDGDGFADVVLGTPTLSDPGLNGGRGYAVFGKTDGLAVPLVDLTVRLGGYRLRSEATQSELGWDLAGAGDVDGDGLRDLVISARRHDPGGVVDGGRSYVVFGGNYHGVLTHRGGDGDDVIDGGPGIDRIAAGAGVDEIHGGGGSDVIYAGAGDDLIGISAGQFFRLDGGSGIDTLAFEDGGVQLDLAVVADVAVRNVEVIDLTGTGDNLLQLSAQDLRALVGLTRILTLRGDALDTAEVDLTGAGFVDQGVAAGVHTWSNGVYVLAVVEPLVANVTL